MSESVGIIHPPPELRAIVDSTAKYVAKNGRAFEEKIMREHRDKPKFSFLLDNDPFNAYYKHKVKETHQQLLENLESSNSNAPQQDEPQQSNTQDTSTYQVTSHQNDLPTDQQVSTQITAQESSPRQTPSQVDGAPRVSTKLNEYIQEMTMKLEEPPVLNYLATSAPNLTHMDCDIIKLTAQFIAIYGRSFLLELVSREQNNLQFDFLKPQHGQFSYLSNLIMQYALVRNYPLDILEQLNKDSYSQKHVLDKIKMRAEWNKMLEIEQKKREEAEQKEKILYSQIDWHDFVIVETIDYQPDEVGAYSPTTADQVGTRLLLQQRNEEQVAPVEMEIDMDMESDDGNESDNL